MERRGVDRSRDWREEVAKKEKALQEAVVLNFHVDAAANDLAEARQGLAAVEELVAAGSPLTSPSRTAPREWFDQFQDTYRVGRTSFEVEV